MLLLESLRHLRRILNDQITKRRIQNGGVDVIFQIAIKRVPVSLEMLHLFREHLGLVLLLGEPGLGLGNLRQDIVKTRLLAVDMGIKQAKLLLLSM